MNNINLSIPVFLYFSELLDRKVIDSKGAEAGQVYDVIVKSTGVYPQSSGLIIRKGFPNRKYAVIKWENITEISQKEIKLKTESSKFVFEEKHDAKSELALRRDILDQQVVDTHNHKVIRVNDIHFLYVDNCLMVAHVDISLRGLVRRMGFEPAVDFIVRIFNRNASYLINEHLLSWKFIQPLSIIPVSMTIKVDIPQNEFNRIPSADMGEIFLDLNIKQQIALFKSLDLAVKAKVFTNIDFKTQKSLVEELGDKETTDLLGSIPSDEATDFLEKLPKAKVESILGVMESKYAKKLSQLLGYSSDSAGGLMTTEYLVFTKDTAIESVIKQIKEKVFKTEPTQFIYIVDENNHFIGSTNFRRLFLANPQDTIQTTAFSKVYFVNLNSGVKEVAYLMEKYKYYAVPVVDDNNQLQGIITVDDVLSQVIAIAWRRLKKIKAQLKQ